MRALEHFPEKNPNPVLSVEKDGTVLYSNEAAKPLLIEWGARIGEKLPSYIQDIVQRVLSRNNPEKIELKLGKGVYFVDFHPFPEEECVNIYGFDISDRKEIEDKIRERDALEITNFVLADILNPQEIQSLMDEFYKFAHITMALVDLRGNILVKVGWQDICTRFHRIHPETCKHCMESDTKLSAGVVPGEFKLYRCKNNMLDIATPIMISGQHVGNLFTGQFFFDDELLDYELFKSQARIYGFNEEEYIAALEKVPRLSRETVNNGMAFLTKLANMISQLSYSNIKLAQSLAERDVLVEALHEGEKRERARSDELAAVLDAVPVAVYISHDPHTLKIIGNRLSYEWLQLPMSANFSKSAPEGERPETFKLLKDGVEMLSVDMPSQMAAAGIEVNDCELDIVSTDGKIRHVLGNARPLRDEQGKISGSISAFIDITERKKAEEALKQANDNLDKLVKERTAELEKAYNSLKESETSLAEAQEMAHIGNWDWDIATGKAYWSNELYRIFGRDPQKLAPTIDEFHSYIHPDDRHDYVNMANKALKEKSSLCIDFRIISDDGEERRVYLQSKIIFNETNDPIQIKGIVRDITESKKAEEKIHHLANIVESSEDAIGTLTLDGTIISWNKGAEKVYGYSVEEILGKRVSILAPPHLDKETIKLIEKIKQREQVNNFDTLRLRKEGKTINVSITLSPVFDTSGKLTNVSFISRDITKRKEAEEALAKIEIARKQEIHHRIKNNLQVISSLLDLQAEKFRGKKIEDSNVLEAFKESQDRVISMALIHEELHKGGETDTLNFSNYIEELAEKLFLSYRLGNESTSLNKDIEEDIFFNMDVGVPLGIIVNELVSNSLKYAFSDRDKGEIAIRLKKEENGECKMEGNKSTTFVLSVSDNGVGISENIDIEDLDSLGLQLVTTLVDQLDGELELRRDNGTKFTIRFMVTENNNPASVPTIQQSD